MFLPRTAALIGLCLPAAAMADAPSVIADTAVVHSIATRIAAGTDTTPGQLLSAEVSAHHGSLRPSDARRLSNAEVVIWTGAALTPWLEPAIEGLAGEATSLELLAMPDWPALTGSGLHSHGPSDDAPDDDHDAPDDHDDHDDHTEGQDTARNDQLDPHAWLDPAIAAYWGTQIAETLAAADPAQAAAYRANAAAFAADMAALTAEIDAALAPARGADFVVAHDAYGYFSRAFDLTPAGTILSADAEALGPRHLSDMRALMTRGQIACVITDWEAPADTVDLVASATNAKVTEVDLEGRTLAPGADLYPALMRGLAAGIAECIAGD